MANGGRNTCVHELTIHFIISSTIHALLIFLIISISYSYYHENKKISVSEITLAVRINPITISQNNEILQSESEQNAKGIFKRRGIGRGPYGLNDEAGRELVDNARSWLSITPDNFLEYDRIRSLRKGMNLNFKKKKDTGFPFSTGVDHKLKTDFQECYENICAIINFPKKNHASPEEKSKSFTAAVSDYLDGKRHVRTWRTLWMMKKPASMKDKIELVRLLRRLNNYSLDSNDVGYEHMRGSIDSIMRIIPDEIKFPANGKK